MENLGDIYCKFPSPMPNFNFSRNSLKELDKYYICRGPNKSRCKDIQLTTTPVLHEIQGVEDIKVLSFSEHLGSDNI